MNRFFMEAGPLIWPIVLLTLVILTLFVWNSIALLARRSDPPNWRRQRIDAILFWGGVAALLGFLGQWIGIHRMAQIVATRGIVNPQAVSYGISESLLTPVSGMAVLVVAAFLWFCLRLCHWSIASDDR